MNKVVKPEPVKRRVVQRDTISRERVRQIQETALGRLRRRLYAMGITCMNDIK